MTLNEDEPFPRVRLLPGRSPLEPLSRLSAHLGGRKIYVKRDDEGGRGGGGNKLRKFERQFADAQAQDADTLVIAAHPQSNAARELAGAAARFGLRAVIAVKDLVGRDTVPFKESGNALLLDLLGADLVWVPADEDFSVALSRIADQLRSEGARPYVLPFGASDALGVLGYVDCAQEIIEQTNAMEGRDPDLIVVATGSGGTQAGLVAGIAKSGSKTKVVGFTILKPAGEAASDVLRLANEALKLDRLRGVSASTVIVDGRARGGGYGAVTEAGIDAIRLMARLEGLFLEPVYTGKAAAGFISYLATEEVPSDAIVVFVHTGGLPFLFAYPDAFRAGDSKTDRSARHSAR